MHYHMGNEIQPHDKQNEQKQNARQCYRNYRLRPVGNKRGTEFMQYMPYCNLCSAPKQQHIAAHEAVQKYQQLS